MDTKISRADLRMLREQLDKEGWSNATLDLFEQEMILAEHVTGEFAKMRVRLAHAGIAADKLEALMTHLARLVLEPALLLDRAHKEQWTGFLPDENMATQFIEPSRKFGAVRKTFASVAWDTQHVRTIRPDLTEFQAKVFLERHQAEIMAPTRDTGWATIARLLQGYKPAGIS